jgi:hypothetical protein
MKIKHLYAIGAAAAVLACASANAITSEGFRASFDGGTTWTPSTIITDNGVGDLFPTAGTIFASFSFNNITVTISVAGTGNSSGSGSPIMDFSIGGVMNPGTSVIVELSANGFTPPSGGAYKTEQKLNGVGYSVTETTRIGTGVNGNDLFAAGGSMPSIGPLSPPTIGATSTGVAPAGTSNPYSITISEIITADQSRTAPATLSIDTTVTVPDGGSTLLMLGSALSVLGGLGMLRKKAVKA